VPRTRLSNGTFYNIPHCSTRSPISRIQTFVLMWGKQGNAKDREYSPPALFGPQVEQAGCARPTCQAARRRRPGRLANLVWERSPQRFRELPTRVTVCVAEGREKELIPWPLKDTATRTANLNLPNLRAFPPGSRFPVARDLEPISKLLNAAAFCTARPAASASPRCVRCQASQWLGNMRLDIMFTVNASTVTLKKNETTPWRAVSRRIVLLVI